MTDDELDQRVRASLLSEEQDTALLERSIRERLHRPRVQRGAVAVAAGLALIVAGGFAYRQFFGPRTPPVCIAAARDHSAEVANGLPREWLPDVHAIQSLAAQQGIPAEAITALGTTGYRFERGRLCFLKNQIFLHLVYTKGDEVFSVYLRRRDPEMGFGPSIRQASFDTEELAYFQTDRMTVVFVDEQMKTEALAFARAGLHSLTVAAL
jgi:hypothetical protein